ncbi:MAG: serine/threonine-protein kinase [Chloroflexota bacterium]
MPLQAGQTLNNRYRIVRLLGQGGFGAVYRAWDTNLSRPCAVKENLDTSPEASRQFAREASVLANLSHPNLPRVTDHFTIPDQGQYLVMDFVEGEDLASLMQQRGILPVDQALGWISQVADALSYLHSRQPPVVHRDIKPANIRITPEGKATLVDFGLVKFFDPGLKTTIGARAVTPGYAPPEQYGQGSTDTRSDIYALGATFYNLITNQQPLESVRRMVGGRMRSAQEINPQVPQHVGMAIERAMAIEPGQRYQNAEEFKNALKLTAPRPVMPPPSTGGRIDETMVVTPQSEARVRPASQMAAPRVSAPPASSAGVGYGRIPAQRPAKTRGSRVTVGLGVAALIVICLGFALGIGYWAIGSDQRNAQATEDAAMRATLDERVRTTSTAQAASTATLRAVATVTAQVQQTAVAKLAGTATAQAAVAVTEHAREDFMAKLLASRTLVYGPSSGSLAHNSGDGLISADQASVDFSNMVIEVRLYNPYATTDGTWDYGLLFRHAGKNDQYRLVLRSDKTWVLLNNSGDADGVIVVEDELPSLNTSQGGWNTIRLICQNEQGYFYLNDAFVTELDLSARLVSGDVFVATGIYLNDEIDGNVTEYQQFTIWSIP